MKTDSLRWMSSSSLLIAGLLIGSMIATKASAFQSTRVPAAPSRRGGTTPSLYGIPPPSIASCRDAVLSVSRRTRRATLRSSPNDDDNNPTSSAAVDTDEQPPQGSGEDSPPPPQEDPELVALKKEIADVESALKAKKRSLMSTKDSVEEYSKQGYARKVAEMENMRRSRSTLNKSNRSYATAAVVSEFVPVYDRLVELKERYSDLQFAQQYDALAGTLRSALAELGVQDFSVQVGERVDVDRMNVLEKQVSQDVPNGAVLEVVNNRGLELKGNVVRRADVVASSGPEVAAVEDGADDGPGEEEDGEGAPATSS